MKILFVLILSAALTAEQQMQLMDIQFQHRYNIKAVASVANIVNIVAEVDDLDGWTGFMSDQVFCDTFRIHYLN